MIGHVGIKVSDLARSIAFYDRVLNFKQVKMFRTQSGQEGCFLKDKESFLEVIQVADSKPPTQDQRVLGVTHFSIEAADIDEMFKAIERKGIEVTPIMTGGSGLRLFSFKDPDGIRVEVSEPL